MVALVLVVVVAAAAAATGVPRAVPKEKPPELVAGALYRYVTKLFIDFT